MNNQLLHAIQDSALPTLLTFLLLGATGGLIVGIWLAVWPLHFFRVTGGLNRWMSARRALKIWETPVHWERFFYRHHRLFGIAILLATGWTLYYFVRVYSAETVLRTATGFDHRRKPGVACAQSCRAREFSAAPPGRCSGTYSSSDRALRMRRLARGVCEGGSRWRSCSVHHNHARGI